MCANDEESPEVLAKKLKEIEKIYRACKVTIRKNIGEIIPQPGVKYMNFFPPRRTASRRRRPLSTEQVPRGKIKRRKKAQGTPQLFD